MDIDRLGSQNTLKLFLKEFLDLKKNDRNFSSFEF